MLPRPRFPNVTAPTTPTVRDGSGQMFDAIAPRYDLLNRVISLGVDQRWRRKTVAALALREGATALDVATGTGDLALLIANTLSGVTVLGVDPSEKMLAMGRKKVAARGHADRIRLELGVAESLPYANRSVDGVCIAFGIRNVVERGDALSEMARVTRPGGRIAVLELSEPSGGLVGPFARFHVHTVVPWVGSLLSGASEYRYLQRSIAAFPPPEEFAKLMESSGLRVLSVERLTFGVCHLYVATPKVA
jgi:demethylmenaquinone methyltransferase/2-methoxy-6-polyprenyl-1,4-benzoquinol methylase